VDKGEDVDKDVQKLLVLRFLRVAAAVLLAKLVLILHRLLLFSVVTNLLFFLPPLIDKLRRSVTMIRLIMTTLKRITQDICRLNVMKETIVLMVTATMYNQMATTEKKEKKKKKKKKKKKVRKAKMSQKTKMKGKMHAKKWLVVLKDVVEERGQVLP
jgi:sorbitol-specific phosphotransferase system component IIBC